MNTFSAVDSRRAATVSTAALSAVSAIEAIIEQRGRSRSDRVARRRAFEAYAAEHPEWARTITATDKELAINNPAPDRADGSYLTPVAVNVVGMSEHIRDVGAAAVARLPNVARREHLDLKKYSEKCAALEARVSRCGRTCPEARRPDCEAARGCAGARHAMGAADASRAHGTRRPLAAVRYELSRGVRLAVWDGRERTMSGTDATERIDTLEARQNQIARLVESLLAAMVRETGSFDVQALAREARVLVAKLPPPPPLPPPPDPGPSRWRSPRNVNGAWVYD